MPTEQFIDHNFSSQSLTRLSFVLQVLKDYAEQGYDLTLRQLYYQLVARDIIPNKLSEYKRLGTLVSNARRAGYIDWGMIKDRARVTKRATTWDSPAQIIRASAHQFKIDKWADQDYYVEVLVEKDALSGILEPVCMREGVRFTACRGYSSDSHMYNTGKRIEKAMSEGRQAAILHLADHDPSGIDMTRDIADRLSLFSWHEVGVKRLALNMDQVEELQPPENPAKITDSRYEAYVIRFGDKSWELDAIEPAELEALVARSIDQFRDDDLWMKAVTREEEMKARLLQLAKDWSD